MIVTALCPFSVKLSVQKSVALKCAKYEDELQRAGGSGFQGRASVELGPEESGRRGNGLFRNQVTTEATPPPTTVQLLLISQII